MSEQPRAANWFPMGRPLVILVVWLPGLLLEPGMLMGPVLGAAAERVTAEGAARLQLRKHDRVALVGNALAERMNRGGHFEALLHARFPDLELTVRNFGWPGDEVGCQQRPVNYTTIDDPFLVFHAKVLVCFFGYNESFAGSAGLPKFKANLARYVIQTKRALKDESLRMVLVSPTAVENPHEPLLPDGAAHNARLRDYTLAMGEVAAELAVPFVDLFAPTLMEFADQPGLQFTINGVHLNERGDRRVAELLAAALFPGAQQSPVGSPTFEKLRAAVNDKSFVHFHDYRMLNGWYVYGERRAPYDTETFPAEYNKLRRMAAVRDRRVWDLAQGRPAKGPVDDRDTGELPVPNSAFGTKPYSEPKALRYLTPAEALRSFTLPAPYAIQCVASEARFPELANPVQINFDGRGRLWALVMPSYPQWRPGDPYPDDKLLIFEDGNGDGEADRVKVFAGGLHAPLGFEFGQGGVYVAQPPHLLFLQDTDGDDRADQREVLLDGFGSEDTHVGICALEWSPGGELMLLEGVAKSTTVETLHGPWRNRTPAVYGFDPRTQRLRPLIKPALVNPWACVFDGWGQGFYGDGTTAQQLWMTPLSGAVFAGRKSMDSFLRYSGPRLRPMVGNEVVSSRHFPDDAQGNYLFGCVINRNAIPQFRVRDEGSGFEGERLADLVSSSDRNFRPVDPQFGPDGALYFADWHTPLIGHMQYSQRDPNRDHAHGRIYRITAKGRPHLKPAIAAGASLPELLQQLSEPEDRTRYRARRELRDRRAVEVLPAVAAWIGSLPGNGPRHQHHLCEALWVQQGFHAVEPALLRRVLGATDFRARAAAVHVLAEERDFLFGGDCQAALELLRPAVLDEHPRVRLEALRALSFFPCVPAVELALEAVNLPLDRPLRYTLQSTLGALEPVWRPRLAANAIARNNPAGLAFLQGGGTGHAPRALVQQQFASLIQHNLDATAKANARAVLAATRGKAAAGEAIFQRACTACHRMGAQGTDFGPPLDDVGRRLRRTEIIESILEPSAKVDPRYASVSVATLDGKVCSGQVVAEDAATLTLRPDPLSIHTIQKSNIEERTSLKISVMPDGLAATLSAEEFVDLVEFLAARQQERPLAPHP